MKNIFKKNSIIITALAIMIVIAGYLSFTTRDAKTNDKAITTSSNKTANTSKDNKDVASTTKGDKTDTNKDTDKNDQSKDNKDEIGSKDSQDVTDNGELNLEDGTPGEAVLASTADASYFSSAKLEREQLRAKNQAAFLKIIESTKASAEDKKAANKGYLQLISNSDKERAAEIMLGAKGFSDAIVFINNNKVEVTVNSASLTKQQTAIIEDVVKTQTGISVQDMQINPVVLQD